MFPKSGPAHDPASRSRFESKVGPARMQELSDLGNNKEWREDIYTRARRE